MANWSGGVLTAAGRALQLKVESGTKLELTKIKLGDGNETSAEVDNLTDLVSARAELAISAVKVSNGLCKVTGVILTTNVEAGFYSREWGLFAKDPDAGEILYMISLDSNPDYIPPKSAELKASATYAMNIAVQNASTIKVTIDPAGLVTNAILADSLGIVLRNTAYKAGDLLYDTQLLQHNFRLECVTAGTTGATLLDLSAAKLGDHIKDGSAEWVVNRLYTSDGEFFDINDTGDIEPAADPIYSVNFELDDSGDIMPRA